MEVEVLETLQISRGTVLIVKNDKTRTREELSDFWKNNDANGHKVIGVESHALHVIREGSMIGLLICDL